MTGKAVVCTAGGCLKPLPKGRRRFCSDTCLNRVKSRRKRGSPLAAQDNQPKALNGASVLAPDEALDGRGSARGGEGYERFVSQGGVELHEQGWTHADLATRFGVSRVTVTHWLAHHVNKLRDERKQMSWRQPDEAKAALEDFAAFRSRYFKIARGQMKGQPPATTAFHLRWINAILSAIETGGQLMVLSPPRHGKLAADSTPVLTPQGWRTHGELRAGDEVFAPDGTPTEVVAVGAAGEASLAVRFSDGEQVKVHPRHEWRMFDRGLKRYRTVETQEMVDAGLGYGVIRNGEPRRRFLADYAAPLYAPEADLPLDPYTLGVWLGDGRSSDPDICGSPDDLAEIVVELKSRGSVPTWSTRHAATGVDCIGFKAWRGPLRALGVLGDKHIPDVYRTASEEQRRDLLRGLVDTDGHVCPDSGRVRVVGANRRLIGQVGEIASTLGYRPSITMREPALSSSGIQGRQQVWTVQWAPHDGVRQAYLLRKDHRHVTVRRRRSVVAIEACAPEPGRCIQVAHPSQCYLVGRSLIPTHNSLLMAHFVVWQIVRNPDIAIIWVAGNENTAQRFGSLVRDELERNTLLIRDFCGPTMGFKPEVRTGARWTDAEFEVATRTMPQPAPTFKAVGRGGRMLSFDADVIVTDDIEDHGSTQQPGQREDTHSWFMTDLASRKEDHTAWVYIGSRQHPEDLASRLLESEEWESIVESAHDLSCRRPEGDYAAHVDCVLWPEVRPYRYLMQKMRTVGERVFDMQYLNNPKSIGAVVFAKDDIEGCFDRSRRMGDRAALPPGLRLIGGLDPARAGYQCAFLWAVDVAANVRYCLDIENEKAGGIEHVRSVLLRWGVDYGLKEWEFEGNAAQSEWVKDSEIVDLKQRLGLIVHVPNTGRNKNDVAMGVTSMSMLFAGGKINLPYGDEVSRRKVDAYAKQLRNYSTAWRPQAHVPMDIVMAAWLPEARVQSWQRVHVQEMDVDYQAQGGEWSTSWNQVPWSEPAGRWGG